MFKECWRFSRYFDPNRRSICLILGGLVCLIVGWGFVWFRRLLRFSLKCLGEVCLGDSLNLLGEFNNCLMGVFGSEIYLFVYI